MPDQLEELFAELRSDTINRIQPPGVEAAHRTVRRRRVTSAVAVVAAVAVIAGGATTVGSHVLTGRTPTATNSTAPSPVLLVERKLAGRGAAGKADRTKVAMLPDTGKSTFTGVAAGDYALYLACAHDGLLTADVRIGTKSVAGGSVECSDDPLLTELRFTVPRKDTTVTVAVSGQDNVVYGLKLVAPDPVGADPSHESPPPSEESTFNAQQSAQLLTASGTAGSAGPLEVTTEATQPFALGTFRPGSWDINYACYGPGTLTVIITATPVGGGTPVTSEDPVDCTEEGTLRNGSPTIIDSRSTITISASADAAADNHAGWAYAVLNK
jgi:hypothetical protein